MIIAFTLSIHSLFTLGQSLMSKYRSGNWKPEEQEDAGQVLEDCLSGDLGYILENGLYKSTNMKIGFDLTYMEHVSNTPAIFFAWIHVVHI